VCNSQDLLCYWHEHVLSSVSISGNFDPGIELPPSSTLEETETTLEPDDREQFIRFVRRMVQWIPEHRSTAKELLQDPWLKEQG
jgi:serine/threonine protein kinase